MASSSHDLESRKLVLVLGGGFGGVRTALDLDRLLPPDYSIVLVDKRAYHLPHWQLYETATVYMLRENRQDFEEIEALVGIPYKDIFKGSRVQFVQASVREVFLSDRSVALSFPSVESEENSANLAGLLHFSHLVVALGAETNYFGIAGLSERSYGLKDLDDALNLRDSLTELFSRKKRGDAISVVVGGGGFTGVEFAGELPGFLQKCAVRFGLDYKDVELTIIEEGKSLLPGAKPWLVARARMRLSKLGINVTLGSRILRFEKGKVYCAGGDTITADLLIWTAGVRANSLLERIVGAELSKTSMLVDEHLRLALYPHVYGIGDNVFCFDPVQNCPVPRTAQRAVDQAKVAAYNIAASIEGTPLRSYTPRNPLFIVPIGGKYALADMRGLRLEGALAWCAKMGVGFLYLVSILPLTSAIRLSWKSIVLYTAND
ncbi:MAG: FAD-dependent oxidoreductase [Patescibacteria group bacterium]